MRTSFSRGFTLIEMLVVIGLVAIIGGTTLAVSNGSYAGGAFRSDRDLAVSLLERARTEAMSNVCRDTSCKDGQAHGVAFLVGQYVLFEGASYATRNQAQDSVFEVNPLVTATGTPEIVFAQLTGKTKAATTTLSDTTGRTSAITVNAEGQISWTN